MEDLLIARLLRNLNVLPYRTADDNNSERYHHFPPDRHYISIASLHFIESLREVLTTVPDTIIRRCTVFPFTMSNQTTCDGSMRCCMVFAVTSPSRRVQSQTAVTG